MPPAASSPPAPPSADRLLPEAAVSLADLQRLIRRMFGAKDSARGAEATFLWLSEEVGELAGALRVVSGPDAAPTAADRDALAKEFADVLAWLATLANIAGVDLEAAVRAKYGAGCPRCAAAVCVCDPAKKP